MFTSLLHCPQYFELIVYCIELFLWFVFNWSSSRYYLLVWLLKNNFISCVCNCQTMYLTNASIKCATFKWFLILQCDCFCFFFFNFFLHFICNCCDFAYSMSLSLRWKWTFYRLLYYFWTVLWCRCTRWSMWWTTRANSVHGQQVAVSSKKNFCKASCYIWHNW